MALARPPRVGCRRLDGDHARHAGQSDGISATLQSTARLRIPHRTDRGGVLAGGRHGTRCGDRSVPRQADRREQFVSHAARPVAGRGCRAGGPRLRFFMATRAIRQRLVRSGTAATTQRRRAGPQTSTAPDRLSHRSAAGPRRPSGLPEETSTANVDEPGTIRCTPPTRSH